MGHNTIRRRRGLPQKFRSDTSTMTDTCGRARQPKVSLRSSTEVRRTFVSMYRDSFSWTESWGLRVDRHKLRYTTSF